MSERDDTGYAYADGFRPSEYLSDAALARCRELAAEPPFDIDGDMVDVRRRSDARNAPVLARWVAEHPVTMVETTTAGVATAWVTPRAGVAPECEHRAIVNVPGGGLLTATLAGSRMEAVPIAGTGKVRVLATTYRQAPEHRFPAGSDDLLAVYRAVLEDYAPESIGLCGTSAGGWVLAQAVAAMIDDGLPLPGAIALLNSSALIGSGAGGDAISITHLAEGRRPMTPEEVAAPQRPDEDYFGGVESDDPRVSPACFDEMLRQFPPTQFVTATRDFMLSVAAVTHARLLRCGVDSHLYVQEGLDHAFPLSLPGTPEAADAYAVLWRFFDRHLR